MRNIFRPLAFFALAFLLSAQDSFAQQPQDHVLERIRAESMGHSSDWQKLLFYAKNMFGQMRSLVDSPDFFLAKNGKTDSAAELEATVRAIFERPPEGLDVNRHPLCRYPRRIAWLVKNAGLNPADLPQVRCSDFYDWLNDRHYDGLSLIFSSSYPNNPSSLFGHTFLRMHRKTSEQKSKILDDSVNFSAFPDTDNPIAYTFKGLAGGFPGYFSFTPYYLKVQEYSNADSRDLWEYRLAFTSEEISNVINVLWEIGPHKINYYYFDENCSAVILHFLEAVKPELSLTRLQFWVIPADTVKTVVETPGLKTDLVYRPSALTRFLAKYRRLSALQQEALERIVKENTPEFAEKVLHGFSDEDKAALIDGTIEYIDFSERLAGSNELLTFGSLRASLLKERTHLATPPQNEVAIPEDERPDLGHDSARLGIGGGVMGDAEAYSQYHWRPALHDKLSPDQGYAAGLGIDFFELSIRHRLKKHKLEVSEYYPLKILSLPRLEPIVKRPAWTLSLGTNLDYSCAREDSIFKDQNDDPCRQYMVNGGVGVSLPARRINALSYSLINMTVGHNDRLMGGMYLQPYLESGVVWAPSETVKLNASLTNRVTRPRQGSVYVRHSLSVQGTLALQKDHEVRFSGILQSLWYRELWLGYYIYF